ncbi:hypothetical protein EK904_013022 [Melospiza melodia maxima]|nr:hypothetical protein EK904_013022 [Melospiza melodia maxima]
MEIAFSCRASAFGLLANHTCAGSVTDPSPGLIWAVFALGLSPEPGQERWDRHLASPELCVPLTGGVAADFRE